MADGSPLVSPRDPATGGRCRRVRHRLSVTRGGVEKVNNKPKRPPSSFFLFMDDFREDYRNKHPYIRVTGPMASKAGSKRWRTRTDAEKAPYKAKAEKLRAEYTKKMDVYRLSQPPYVPKAKKLKAEYPKKAAYRSRSESNEEDETGEGDEEDHSGEGDEEDDSDDSSLSGKMGPNEPKRPQPPFFLFMEVFKEKYRKNNPDVKRQCLLSQAGAVVWASMTLDKKAPYLDKAKMLMAEFKEKFRVYKEAQRCPATLDKSKSKRDLHGGGLQVPDDSDKSKWESDLQAGGPEAPGDSDKSKLESHLQAGGLEVPGDYDKSKSENHSCSEAPVDKSKSDNHLQAGDLEVPDEPKSNGEDDGGIVRPLHPPEPSVLGGNGGSPRRQRGAANKLWQAARKIRKIRKITCIRKVAPSS